MSFPPPRRPWGMRYDPAPIPPDLHEQAGRAMTRLFLRHYFRMEHIGKEHIPSRGAAILCSNHPTLGDPFTVAFATPRWVTWLAFDEALDWPVAGFVMRFYHAIPVNLEHPRPSSIKAAYATLARGRVLGMFFEGERSLGYGLNDPLKTGAARMAIRMRCPIVPVTIAGAHRLWPRGKALPSRGKVVVRYHPPIDPTTYRPDLPRKDRGRLLTEELGRIINSALPPEGTPRFWPS